MNKQWKIVIAIAIAGIVIISSIYFIFVLDFFGSSHCPPMKQIAFVNCTYYIYPNRTFAIVNVTEVIPLVDVDLKIEYFEIRAMATNISDFINWTYNTWVKDSNGILDVGDKFFISITDGNITGLSLFCSFTGKTKNGEWIESWGYVWDSEHGPYVWKEEE